MKKIIIVALMIISSGIEAKRMKLKEVEKILEQPTTISSIPSISPAEQEAIKKRLDEQLSAPVEAAWDDRVDDLFKLATVNPELARLYFKRMSEKMVVTDVKPIEIVIEKPKPIEKPAQKEEQKVIAPEKKEEPQKAVEKTVPEKVVEEKAPVEEKPTETTLPAGQEPMKKSTRPAPPKKFGPKPEIVEGAKGETAAQVPSGEESMKTSTRPAPSKKGAPSGGPKKTLAPSSSAKATAVAGKKEVAPKVVEQIFSVPKLQVLDNDRLMELFNDLLQKLSTVPTNWNAMVVEKVEEKTKYGSKTYNVYGAPIAKWTNDMNTLKKVLVLKGIMSETQVSQAIKDRVVQVRAEKKSQQVVSKEAEEKPQEELTESDLVKLIKSQLAEPKQDQIGWVVSIKGNIKALDKINHGEALKYHDQFIKITKEKPFLK